MASWSRTRFVTLKVEVAPGGSREGTMLRLMPTPTTAKSILLPTNLASTRIPPSLRPPKIRSFGHFTPILSPIVRSRNRLAELAA